MDNPEIAVIILNWKDTSNTMKCIGSLKNESSIKTIFIINNENSRPLPLYSREYSCELIQIQVPENRGFSAGINVGLIQVQSMGFESVLIINNDATLTPGCLDRLQSTLRHQQNTGMVSPLIRNPNSTIQTIGSSIQNNHLRINEFSSEFPDYLTFACVLIKTSTLDKVGYLDEAFFMYWEDVDFGLRVKAAGLELGVVPEATAIHAVSSSRKIAGSRVDLYSAFGLGAFGVLHPHYKFGSYFRITLRVLKRVALLKFSFAYKLWKAFRDGQKLDRPSYLKVTKENWPL